MLLNRIICGALLLFLLLGCKKHSTEYAVPEVGPVVITGYSETQSLTDFSQFVKERAAAIIAKYNPGFDKQVKVVLYSSARALHEAQGQPDAPDWLVGQARSNGEIWMVYPYNSTVHSYEDMKKILLHEYTHIVIYSVNPFIPSWLNEGIAGYEADQHKTQGEIATLKAEAASKRLPNYLTIDDDLSTGIVYKYARSVVEYVQSTYALDGLKKLIQNPNVVEVFQISQSDFQEGWRTFIMEKY